MAKDKYTKSWIIQVGIPIIEESHGNITIRALHYRLVGEGMTNDLNHYKRVVGAMIDARWAGDVDFDAFMDHERETIGITDYHESDVDESVDRAKTQIKAWATSYTKNRWENQPIYPEVFIEKKALQGIFERPCSKWDVALNPCKGHPSLTFLYDAKKRFDDAIAEGKEPVILYFGDYDCSGEDIPRSIQENLSKMGTEVDLRRVMLMEDQVREWKLPFAPTKVSDTRSKKWEGLGQVELDAAYQRIPKILDEAIKGVFNQRLYDDLMNIQAQEQKEFKSILKRDFKKLLD